MSSTNSEMLKTIIEENKNIIGTKQWYIEMQKILSQRLGRSYSIKHIYDVSKNIRKSIEKPITNKSNKKRTSVRLCIENREIVNNIIKENIDLPINKIKDIIYEKTNVDPSYKTIYKMKQRIQSN